MAGWIAERVYIARIAPCYTLPDMRCVLTLTFRLLPLSLQGSGKRPLISAPAPSAPSEEEMEMEPVFLPVVVVLGLIR